MAIVILGLMAAIVVKSMPSGNGDSKQVIDELLEEAGTPVTAGSGVSRGLGGQADRKACNVIVRTLQTASESYRAAHGAPPATVGDLVNARYLSEEPDLPGYSFTFEVVEGTPTGTVQVNGLDADRGCGIAQQ